jgi:hypothetical protein
VVRRFFERGRRRKEEGRGFLFLLLRALFGAAVRPDATQRR